MLATSFFPSTERKFTRLAQNANAYGKGDSDTEYDTAPPRLPAGAEDKLRDAVARIEATPYGHGLAGRLADFVRTRQEVDVRRIRPLQLARRWNVPDRHAIEVCMQAARSDMLAMRWDPPLPGRQVVVPGAGRTADRRPLRYLQHRL